MGKPKRELQPYHHFSMAEWSNFSADEPMTLDAADIQRLRALTDPISIEEAEQVYLPLSRLISLYVEATQGLHRASTRFLATSSGRRRKRTRSSRAVWWQRRPATAEGNRNP